MSWPFLPVRWLITTPDRSGNPDIFPLMPGQTFLTGKGPEWSTNVKTTRSGRELRSANWSVPKWRFQVAYEVLRTRPDLAELARLYEFFNLRQGRFGEFFYWDPTDHDATNEFLGFGSGTNTTFQLLRKIFSWTEPVTAIYGDPVITLDGVVTTAYTVSEYGAVEFDTPPGAGVRVEWSGQFMYRCRFDQDRFTAQQMVAKMWSSEGLTFVSIRL